LFFCKVGMRKPNLMLNSLLIQKRRIIPGLCLICVIVAFFEFPYTSQFIWKRSFDDDQHDFGFKLTISNNNSTKQRTLLDNSTLLVHYIYKDDVIPEQYLKLIKHCVDINPEKIFILWTDDEFEKFVKDSMPQSLPLFKKYTLGIQKSDVMRLFVVYYFGGIYMDMDMECMKPFANSSIYNYPAIIDQERVIQCRMLYNREFCGMNSVLAATRPKHPFFLFSMNRLEENFKHGSTMERTGPVFLTSSYIAYKSTLSNTSDPADNVTMVDPSLFSPLFTDRPDLLSFCHNAKGEWRLKACEELKHVDIHDKNFTEVTKNSILVHRFYNLGYVIHYHKIKARIKLTEKVPSIKLYSQFSIIK